MGRRTTSGSSPYEASFGFSRAIRSGNRIFVSGTAPVEVDGSSTPGDAAAQARRCFAIILTAIEELGGSAADIVLTRMFITDPADAGTVIILPVVRVERAPDITSDGIEPGSGAPGRKRRRGSESRKKQEYDECLLIWLCPSS